MTNILRGLAVAMGCIAAVGVVFDSERTPACCAVLLVSILLLLRIARRPLSAKGVHPTERLPADEKHLDTVKTPKAEGPDQKVPRPQESKSEVSVPKESRPSVRLQKLPSAGAMATPNDEALNGNTKSLQVRASVRPQGRNLEKVRCSDRRGGCLTEEEKSKIKRALETLAMKPCPWYKRADLLKDLLSGLSIESGDGTFCAMIIDFVVNENGWKRESCEVCRDDEVLAPASFGGAKESIVEAIRAGYLDCVVACVAKLGKAHSGGKWLATTLRGYIYNEMKMTRGVSGILQEGNASDRMEWWYAHKVKDIIVEIPSKENCRTWDEPGNERIELVKDLHKRKLVLLRELEGRGVGCKIEKVDCKYRFSYYWKPSDLEEIEKQAEQARRPHGPSERCSLSEENKKRIQHTLNGLAKKPFPWYRKDDLLRKVFDLSELSNVKEKSSALRKRVIDFVVNENDWKRERCEASRDEVFAPSSFVGEKRSIREAVQAQRENWREKVKHLEIGAETKVSGSWVIPEKERDLDGKDLKKEQREFLDKLCRAWSRRRRICVKLRPLDDDGGYGYFYYPGIFDPAAPVDGNGDERVKNWESDVDRAVEMVVDEMDIRYNERQGIFGEDLRKRIEGIVKAKVGA